VGTPGRPQQQQQAASLNGRRFLAEVKIDSARFNLPTTFETSGG
jgi:hypothetical protein